MFTTPGPLDFVAIARETLEFWDRRGVFAALVAEEPRRPALLLPRRADHRQQPHGRASRVAGAPTRTCSSATRPCAASTSASRTASTARASGSRWRSRRRSASTTSARSRRWVSRPSPAPAASACSASPRSRPSSRDGSASGWTGSAPTTRCPTTTSRTSGTSSRSATSAGWLYRGHRVMPWCARCGTSISQHEMLESHVELTHPSVVVAMPIVGRAGRSLLAWTTTPWTLPANVALAVHPELDVRGGGGGRPPLLRRGRGAVRASPVSPTSASELSGADLVGLRYEGPFDDLPAQQGVEQRVVEWEEVAGDEGTGIVHIAPGCGQEDFELGRRHGLAVIAPVDEAGRLRVGPRAVRRARGRRGRRRTSSVGCAPRGGSSTRRPYRHRYPTCWRCGQELIFRLVDEWFIRADELRPLALAANAGVTWHPEHMGLRMARLAHQHGRLVHLAQALLGLAAAVLPVRELSPAHRGRVARGAARRSPSIRRVVDTLPELHRPWIDAVARPLPRMRRGGVAAWPRSATAGSTPGSFRSPRSRTARTARNGRGGSPPISSSRWRRRSAAGSTRCSSCRWRSRGARPTAR